MFCRLAIPFVLGFVSESEAPRALSLRDAIERALAACPGRAVEADFETAAFEVIVVSRQQKLVEVKVDAATGQVTSTQEETDVEAAQELRDFRKILSRTSMSLADLVAKSEEVVKGFPVNALLVAGDEPRCEVRWKSSDYLVVVSVDANAGKLVGLELEDEDSDDDEGQGEDEGKDEDGAAPSPTPLRDGVKFSAEITHPYYPLSKVRYAELQSEDEKVVREVQKATRTIGGVECLVLAEKEYEDGELAEISYNFFAQDAAGNVWYFGEDVDDYEDGEVVGHGGAWRVGRNAKEPCLFMPAELRVGLSFKPENSPPDAEEWDEIAQTDAVLAVPAGRFEQVLVLNESNRPDRWEEQKYYARGIGLISENKELNLVRVSKGTGTKRRY